MDGIILNPAGYSHTSVAIGDAIAAIKIPVVEVHISNIDAREDFRKLSHVSAKCKGTISGLGLKGYALAVEYFFRVFPKACAGYIVRYFTIAYRCFSCYAIL